MKPGCDDLWSFKPWPRGQWGLGEAGQVLKNSNIRGMGYSGNEAALSHGRGSSGYGVVPGK
jgi:hypothetical protein